MLQKLEDGHSQLGPLQQVLQEKHYAFLEVHYVFGCAFASASAIDGLKTTALRFQNLDFQLSAVAVVLAGKKNQLAESPHIGPFGEQPIPHLPQLTLPFLPHYHCLPLSASPYPRQQHQQSPSDHQEEVVMLHSEVRHQDAQRHDQCGQQYAPVSLVALFRIEGEVPRENESQSDEEHSQHCPSHALTRIHHHHSHHDQQVVYHTVGVVSYHQVVPTTPSEVESMVLHQQAVDEDQCQDCHSQGCLSRPSFHEGDCQRGEQWEKEQHQSGQEVAQSAIQEGALVLLFKCLFLPFPHPCCHSDGSRNHSRGKQRPQYPCPHRPKQSRSDGYDFFDGCGESEVGELLDEGIVGGEGIEEVCKEDDARHGEQDDREWLRNVQFVQELNVLPIGLIQSAAWPPQLVHYSKFKPAVPTQAQPHSNITMPINLSLSSSPPLLIHFNSEPLYRCGYCQNTFFIIGSMSMKKEKASREQYQARAKAQREAHLREAQEYKDRMRPLVRFLRDKKLKFAHAQVSTERVEYFRLDEFEKLVAQHKAAIEADERLGDLVKKASNEFVFFRRPDHIKAKYPKALEPVLMGHPDKKFASFRFDTTQSRHLLTIVAIVGVLALVLFPIWPFGLKYGIWLVSLVLLVALVGIMVVRLVVYLLVVIFDYHVWIFPNFLNSTGFWDSFVPVIEVSRGDKSWLNIFIRLFAFSSFILLILHIYLNPTFIDDQISFTKETIQDVHDWGVGKLKNEGNFSQRALTNLEEILNETADVHLPLEQPEEFEGKEAQEEGEQQKGEGKEDGEGEWGEGEGEF